jgi:hypothetical protein
MTSNFPITHQFPRDLISTLHNYCKKNRLEDFCQIVHEWNFFKERIDPFWINFGQFNRFLQDNNTLLTSSIEFSNIEMVKFLVDAGGVVEYQQEDCLRELQVAVRGRCLETCKYLIEIFKPFFDYEGDDLGILYVKILKDATIGNDKNIILWVCDNIKHSLAKKNGQSRPNSIISPLETLLNTQLPAYLTDSLLNSSIHSLKPLIDLGCDISKVFLTFDQPSKVKLLHNCIVHAVRSDDALVIDDIFHIFQVPSGEEEEEGGVDNGGNQSGEKDSKSGKNGKYGKYGQYIPFHYNSLIYSFVAKGKINCVRHFFQNCLGLNFDPTFQNEISQAEKYFGIDSSKSSLLLFPSPNLLPVQLGVNNSDNIDKYDKNGLPLTSHPTTTSISPSISPITTASTSTPPFSPLPLSLQPNTPIPKQLPSSSSTSPSHSPSSSSSPSPSPSPRPPSPLHRIDTLLHLLVSFDGGSELINHLFTSNPATLTLLNFPNQRRFTPLDQAMISFNVEAVQELLKWGGKFTIGIYYLLGYNYSRNTLFHNTRFVPMLRILPLLYNQAKIDQFFKLDGVFMLFDAIVYSNIDFVHFFVDNLKQNYQNNFQLCPNCQNDDNYDGYDDYEKNQNDKNNYQNYKNVKNCKNHQTTLEKRENNVNCIVYAPKDRTHPQIPYPRGFTAVMVAASGITDSDLIKVPNKSQWDQTRQSVATKIIEAFCGFFIDSILWGLEGNNGENNDEKNDETEIWPFKGNKSKCTQTILLGPIHDDLFPVRISPEAE